MRISFHHPGKARRPRRAAPVVAADVNPLRTLLRPGKAEPIGVGWCRRLRSVLALLLVLALPLSVLPGARAAAAPDRAAVCEHCSCGMTGCCVGEAQPTPPSSPAAPLPRTGPSPEWLGILDRRAVRLPAPAATAIEFSPSPTPFLPLGAVPLHARFCCFLI